MRFAQLREEQFILLNEEFVMTRMTRQSCAMAGFAPRVKIVANRSDFIAELVADGQGIAVIAGGRYRFEHDSRPLLRGAAGRYRRYRHRAHYPCRSGPKYCGGAVRGVRTGAGP